MDEKQLYDCSTFEVLAHNGKHGNLLLIKFSGGVWDSPPVTEVYIGKDGSYLGSIIAVSAYSESNPDLIYDTNYNSGPIAFFIDGKVKACRDKGLVVSDFKSPIDFLVEYSKPQSVVNRPHKRRKFQV